MEGGDRGTQRAMSIRYAILGLITEQPMHGYRLKGAFERRMTSFWGLTTGQIYQTLASLERNGLVESHEERVGRRPARRIYSATPAGTRALDEWLHRAPTTRIGRFRDDALLRMMLLRERDRAELSPALARREAAATSLLASVMHMRRRLRRNGDADVRTVFLYGIARHLAADIETIRRSRAAIDRRQHRARDPRA